MHIAVGAGRYRVIGPAIVAALAMAFLVILSSVGPAEAQSKLSPPGNLTATPTDGGLQVTWSNAANTGVGLVQDQFIRWKRNDTNTYVNPKSVRNRRTEHEVVGGNPSSYTITGLQNGVSYTVEVAHKARSYESPFDGSFTYYSGSDWASASAVAGAPVPPGAPALLPAGESIGVSWAAPDNNNGSVVTGYGVQYRKSSETAWTDSGHSGAGLSARIAGLEASAEYLVRVRAQNARGWSNWSAAATAIPFDALSFGDATASDRTYTALAETPNPDLSQDEVVALKLPESTGGGFVITYSASGLPAGLRLTQDRIIRGTPQAATNGPVTVTYTVSDEAGGSASLSFQVTVNPALTFSDEARRFFNAKTPTYDLGAGKWLDAGDDGAITFPAASGGTGTLTYHLDYSATAQPLADVVTGVTFDPATRKLGGAPTEAGEWAVLYWVEDENGAKANGDTTMVSRAGGL